MNILSDQDLKTHMNRNQVYVTKEVCNYNFKTQFEANKVYFIDGIDVDWINDDTVCIEIFFEGENCQFHRTCSKLALYAEMKSIFIPVSEMYEAWKIDSLSSPFGRF
jgi:hypothetical protein